MNHKIKITVNNTYDDREIQLSLNRFSSVDDWKHAFKTIMIHETFDSVTVDEMFGDFEEYTSNPGDIIL
jgi:hypothetical protein